jgi:hypothetical protein
MAVASGIYPLTMEKLLINTLAESWEATDNYLGLVTDTHTPDFQTHDFVDDITNEITGGNYARETIDTSVAITVEAGGVIKFDTADIVYDNAGSNDVTITNAEAAFHGFNVGSDATDPLGFMSDFGAPYSCSNSTFTVQWHTNGIWTIDFVP